MENISQHGIAESGLSTLLSYIESLIREAIEPYKEQIQGKWQAQGIHQSVVQAYARAWTLSEFVMAPLEEGKSNPYNSDKEVRRVAYHLCQVIDRELVTFFSEHGQGLIWVPDFNAYGELVYQKMAEILQESAIYENKKIRNNRENRTAL
jgi:hypothetical protein